MSKRLNYYKLLILILSILFISCFTKNAVAQDQRFSSGLLLGINGSQVNGDEMAGFNKGGLLGGIYVSYPFSEKWSGQFEMLFTQKGSRKVRTEQNPNPAGYWDLLRLNYIEVPVFAKYHITDRWEAYAGISGAYLMGTYLEDWVGGSRDVDFIRKTDFSIHGGASYHISPRLSATLRYTNSIFSISKGHSNLFFAPRNSGMINLVASFGLYYHFVPNKSSKW